MPKIVFLDAYALNPGDLDWQVLQNVGECVFYDRTPSEKIIERANDADIVLVNKVKMSDETMAQLPNLKYIGVSATGYDIIDTAAAQKRGIVVTNVRGYSSMSVAQHTFALMLHIANETGRYVNDVKNGRWTTAPDWTFCDEPLQELANKTLAIIGLGDIGQSVAGIATAFGMNVVAYRRDSSKPNPLGIELVSLADALSKADVVSLHCPLTADSREIINAQTIAQMKPSAWLLNTSRGGLLNEQDVADALNEGRLAAAGLDVLSTEPPLATNPLLSAKNCYITPHQAWGTIQARQRLLTLLVENIVGFLKNKPINVVNFE